MNDSQFRDYVSQTLLQISADDIHEQWLEIDKTYNHAHRTTNLSEKLKAFLLAAHSYKTLANKFTEASHTWLKIYFSLEQLITYNLIINTCANEVERLGTLFHNYTARPLSEITIVYELITNELAKLPDNSKEKEYLTHRKKRIEQDLQTTKALLLTMPDHDRGAAEKIGACLNSTSQQSERKHAEKRVAEAASLKAEPKRVRQSSADSVPTEDLSSQQALILMLQAQIAQQQETIIQLQQSLTTLERPNPPKSTPSAPKKLWLSKISPPPEISSAIALKKAELNGRFMQGFTSAICAFMKNLPKGTRVKFSSIIAQTAKPLYYEGKLTTIQSQHLALALLKIAANAGSFTGRDNLTKLQATLEQSAGSALMDDSTYFAISASTTIDENEFKYLINRTCEHLFKIYAQQNIDDYASILACMIDEVCKILQAANPASKELQFLTDLRQEFLTASRQPSPGKAFTA